MLVYFLAITQTSILQTLHLIIQKTLSMKIRVPFARLAFFVVKKGEVACYEYVKTLDYQVTALSGLMKTN